MASVGYIRKMRRHRQSVVIAVPSQVLDALDMRGAVYVSFELGRVPGAVVVYPVKGTGHACSENGDGAVGDDCGR